jgi:hypothetical protein
MRTMNRGVRKLSTINSNMQNYMEQNVATKKGLLEVQKIFDVEKKNSMIDYSQTP